MSVVNHFHLYLNDYCAGESGLLRGRLFLNGKLEKSNNLKDLLSTRLAGSQNFEAQWGKILSATRAGEENVLHVHGSEFSRLFFSAISRNADSGFRFSVVDDVSPAPLKVIGGNLFERLSVIRQLSKKYDVNANLPTKITIATIGEVSNVEEIRSALNGSDLCVQTGMTVSIKNLSDCSTDEFFIPIATSATPDIPWIKIADSNNLLFILNPAVKIDGTLVPDFKVPRGESSYLWRFADWKSLVAVAQEYVSSYLVMPAMASLCQKICLAASSRIGIKDLIALKRLYSVMPFYCAIIPDKVIVDREGKILLHAEDIPQTMNVGVDVCCPDVRVEQGEDGLKEITFTPRSLESVAVKFEVSHDIDVASADVWGIEHFIVRKNGSEYHLENSKAVNVDIVNHCLTTEAEIEINGAIANKTFEMPVGDRVELRVVAKNKYERNIDPVDAGNWRFTIDGAECVECQDVGSGVDRRLVITPQKSGAIVVHIRWDIDESSIGDPLVRHTSLHVDSAVIAAIARAKHLHYEIYPEAGPTASAIRIRKDKSGNTEVDCYSYDTLKFRAWVDGDDENLWDTRVEAPGVVQDSWSDSSKEFKIAYRSIGTKRFQIKAIDPNVNETFFITCNVIANYSLTARRTMVVAFLLALFHAWLIYGINFWCFLVYLFPIGTYAFYKKKRCPYYARLMLWLLFGSVFILIRALWQEIS